MRYLYTLLLVLAAPFLLFGLYRKKEGKPKIGQRWVEHFGFTPVLKTSSDEKPIWLHAVSVGEIIAAKPIINALRARYPATPIVITTTTTTGAEIAAKLSEQIYLVEHRYMPIDFPFAVKGFIDAIQPKALLIMETELWPNILHAVKKANLTVVVMNARLSESAAKKYQKIKFIFSTISSNIDHICCQFEQDAQRFTQLGVKKENISVTGSVKFDLSTFDSEQTSIKEIKQQIGDRPVWIASSTHSGEDEPLLEAHHLVLKKYPAALLILVPRHPERFNTVANIIEAQKLKLIKRSERSLITKDIQVYLGDTMGEMMAMYALADLAFMAGSLLGDKVGGHNLLEPASLAKPLLTGSSYFNFQIIGAELIQAQACKVCQTPQEIADAVTSLFADDKLREKTGRAALSIVEKNRGAVEKTLEVLKKLPSLQ